MRSQHLPVCVSVCVCVCVCLCVSIQYLRWLSHRSTPFITPTTRTVLIDPLAPNNMYIYVVPHR